MFHRHEGLSTVMRRAFAVLIAGLMTACAQTGPFNNQSPRSFQSTMAQHGSGERQL